MAANANLSDDLDHITNNFKRCGMDEKRYYSKDDINKALDTIVIKGNYHSQIR